MRIVSNIDSDKIVYGETVYKASPDGTFEVPEEVGRDLTAYPHWDLEWVAQAREIQRQREEDADPSATGRRVRELEARVVELEKLLAKPKRTRRPRAESPQAIDEPDDDEADDTADDE